LSAQLLGRDIQIGYAGAQRRCRHNVGRIQKWARAINNRGSASQSAVERSRIINRSGPDRDTTLLKSQLCHLRAVAADS